MAKTEAFPCCAHLPETAGKIVEASLHLAAIGMNRGSCGNIRVRCHIGKTGENGFLITPSGVTPMNLSPESLCIMRLSGEKVGSGRPSSEWRIHRDIYASRPDIHAIVHTHSTFATTLACMQREVPPFHYMIAVTGSNTIPCAPYALFGSQELSDNVLKSLGNRFACLLAHHGMVALGHNLDHALAVAVEVESLCEQYWRILQAEPPKILSDAQMEAVHEKFQRYFTT